jgi:hypothetical protein
MSRQACCTLCVSTLDIANVVLSFISSFFSNSGATLFALMSSVTIGNGFFHIGHS